uniref:Uncharacterized protein n=1 Tax=viral metagenome TaxID=1070528 RepID=A0A6C0J658_9ZZZZ
MIIIISLLISLINLVLCLLVNKFNKKMVVDNSNNNLLISTLGIFIISLIYFEFK